MKGAEARDRLSVTRQKYGSRICAGSGQHGENGVDALVERRPRVREQSTDRRRRLRRLKFAQPPFRQFLMRLANLECAGCLQLVECLAEVEAMRAGEHP